MITNLDQAQSSGQTFLYSVSDATMRAGQVRHSLPVDKAKWKHRIYWGYVPQVLYSQCEIRFSLNGNVITTLPLRQFLVNAGQFQTGLYLDDQTTTDRPFFMASRFTAFPEIRSSGFDVCLTMDRVLVVVNEVEGVTQNCFSALAIGSN